MVERLINFAARVGKVVDALPDTRMGRHIGGQLVRSGTSPAPNYEEACAAESRADFIHKLSISLKELSYATSSLSRYLQRRGKKTRHDGSEGNKRLRLDPRICNLQFAICILHFSIFNVFAIRGIIHVRV